MQYMENLSHYIFWIEDVYKQDILKKSNTTFADGMQRKDFLVFLPHAFS